MPHHAAFHLGLHCLPKYLFTSIQSGKGYSLAVCILVLISVSLIVSVPVSLRLGVFVLAPWVDLRYITLPFSIRIGIRVSR